MPLTDCIYRLINPGFQPIGLVRSEKSAKPLKKAGATEEQIKFGDILDVPSLKEAMKGCDAVVLCTSATPKVRSNWTRR